MTDYREVFPGFAWRINGQDYIVVAHYDIEDPDPLEESNFLCADEFLDAGRTVYIDRYTQGIGVRVEGIDEDIEAQLFEFIERTEGGRPFSPTHLKGMVRERIEELSAYL